MSKTFILGPCAAESREQVLEIAEQLNSQLSTISTTLNSKLAQQASTLNFIYRAGIWKPRTSPTTFQGVGEAGLPWLQEVQERYHFPVATEVATPEHVQKVFDTLNSTLAQRASTTLNSTLAQRASTTLNSTLSTLNYYMWLGARTSANPIAVQAIADSLSAINNPTPLHLYSSTPKPPKAVLIKNPSNEDVNLWIGNVERLLATGVKVMAIHRGCNHQPCWSMAFEFRRRMPHIPLLLDPSHMSGDAAKVPALCQLAMDLDYDGLMIEVHNDPAHALSDAKQQITPAQAIDIISNLQYRNNSQLSTIAVGATTLNSKLSTLNLNELRSEIDEVDDQLWSLIAKRLDIAKRIGDYKKEHNLPILQPKRYDEIVEKRLQWAKKNGIPEDTVQSIIEALHSAAVKKQITPLLS